MEDEQGQTYVCMSILTKDCTHLASELSADGIATIEIRDYPISVEIHVTRQSLRNLIDACLDLQAKIAEKERKECPT